MTTETLTANTEAAILSRVIEPDEPTLSADAARSILALGFCQADMNRMNALVAKAREGTLRPKEDAERNNFLRVEHFVALVQAKARKSLQQRAGAATKLGTSVSPSDRQQNREVEPMDTIITRVIKLTRRLDNLVQELKTDWEYLSEERDRWKRVFNFEAVHTPQSTDSLIVKHVEMFEKLLADIRKAGLASQKEFSDMLESGKQYAERIKSGELLSYSAELGCAQVGPTVLRP